MKTWWQNLLHNQSDELLAGKLRRVSLKLPGWTEKTPSGEMRIWRHSDGDVLSLAAVAGSLDLPSFDDIQGLQRRCRAAAENAGAGLIEARTSSGNLGAAVEYIYKRLEIPAYHFTCMMLIPCREASLVWTVVCSERGLTGVREAVVATELLQTGRLTIEGYERSWARDPYDSNYRGVDRRVLRFFF